MSSIDVGKDAKRKGATHPKNAPTPADRATPKARAKSKPDKPFGFRYEYARWRGGWIQMRRWFKTERQRDQAFDKELKSQAEWGQDHILFRYRNLTKVQR